MKSRVIVEAGICGLNTEIIAEAIDFTTVKMEIRSDCPNINEMNADLAELNIFDELKILGEKSKIMKSFKKHGLHADCPVPVGMIKAIEVAAGLALPADVRIKITKEVD